MKGDVVTEQIERITEMESILDNAELAIFNLRRLIKHFMNIRRDIQKLLEYSQSELFMKDYKADRMGMLPDDLKRGVLSEDGISSLLEHAIELKREIEMLREQF